MDHESAKDYYSASLQSAITYFYAVAGSNVGWKPVAPPLARSASTSTVKDSPSMTAATTTPSKAADPSLAAIASNVQIAKRKYPGKSAELVRATTLLPGTYDERTDLEDWRCMFESAGIRKEWDDMIESCSILERVGKSTFITRTIFKTSWRSSPRDLVLIETTLRNENTVLHIATSLPQSKDLPKYLRPTNPYVRARLDLAAYCVQIIPNETPLDDAVSIPLSTSSSQQGHSLRVAFYYQFDLKSWTVNSSISLTTHVPQCIAAVHTHLQQHGRPPHLARHGNKIQIESDEYDADNGLYDLRYSVLEGRDEDEDDNTGSARSRDIPTAKSSGYESATSGNRQREASTDDTVAGIMVGTTMAGTNTVLSASPPSSSTFTTMASLGNDSLPTPPPSTKGHHDDAFRQTSVDVEIDGERWATGVDVRITVLINDRASEAYTRECVDCFRYMNTQRFIVRLRHPSSSVSMLSTKSGGREEELVGVRLKIDRVPRAAATVGVEPATVTAGEVEEMDGMRKSALIVNGQPRQTEEYPMFEDPEQEFMGDEYAEEVDEVDEEIREQEARDNEEKRMQKEGTKMNGSGKQKEDTGSNDNESIGSDQTTSTKASAASNGALPLSSRPVPTLDSITPNPSDPEPVKAAHARFLSLLQEPASSWKPVQQTGSLTLNRMEMPDHVMGVLKGEGVYEGCNVWDIKAAVEAFGARRSWDSMFDDGVVLEQFTPWCSLVYTKLKGFWPTSPRDAVSFNTTYFTTNTVQIFTTSTDDASLSRSIPDAETAGYVRAQVDIAGWHAESSVPTSVHVIYVIQSDPKGWIPAYVLTTMATQAPAVLGSMVEFVEKSGAPPNLVELYNGRMNGVLYDHEKGSWRLEYVPCSDGTFARNPPDVMAAATEIEKTDNTDVVPAEAKGKGKAPLRENGNLNDSSLKNSRDSSSLSVSSSTPSPVLMAEIRLDARKWSSSGDYEVVVDPPPSRVTVTKSRAIDPFGLWMRITHEQEGAPPLGGKVLVMVRKSAVSGWGVAVNGIQTPVIEEKVIPTSVVAVKPVIKVDEEVKKTRKASLDVAKAKPKTKESARVKVKNGDKIELGGNESLLLPKIPTDVKKTSAKSVAPKLPPVKLAKEEPVITPNTPIDIILAKLGSSPVQQVLSALALLRRLDDQQHGWTPVSDKGGLSISKRVVPPEIPEYLALVKAVKVIERFSLEEVAAVVTNSGCRKAWDDMLDEREVLKYLGNGCAVVRSGLKAWFPLKSRDLFTTSCTARASANSSTNSQPSRVFFVETSISDYPHQVPPTDSTAKPRGRLYLYGWMLEAVDPYTTTTNHPIPSTRVTFMASLDMGGTIPGTVSSLVTIGMPKAIQQVETYLKSKGAPPYLTLPPQLIELRDSDLTDEGDGVIPTQRFADVYYELPKASSHTGHRDVVNSEFNHDSREFKVGLKFDLESLSPLVSTPSGHVGTAANETLLSSGEVRDAQDARILSPSVSTSSRAKPASALFMERRGSAPGRFLTDELPNGDKKNFKSKSSVDCEDADLDEKIVLEIIVDLKRYPQGYEILTEVSPLEVNGSIGAVSSLSSASSSSLSSKQPFLSPQPVSVKVVDIPPAKSHTSSLSPSSSKFKHSIHVSVHPSVLRQLIRHRHSNPSQSDSEGGTRANIDQSTKSADDNDGKSTEQKNERFMLDFLLLPLQISGIPDKLTKKGVLGDVVDKWNGMVLVNGGEVQIEAAKGLSEKELAAQTEKDTSTEGQGGVVAKARRRNTLESESSPKPKSPRTPVTSYPGLSWLTGSKTGLDQEKIPNNDNGDQGADPGYDLDMEFVPEPTPPQNGSNEDWAQTTRKLTLGSQAAEPRSSLVPSHSTSQRSRTKSTTPTGQAQTWLGTLQDQSPEGQYPFSYLLVMGTLCLLLGMMLRAWLIVPHCGAGCSTASMPALPVGFALGDSRGYQQGSFKEMVVFKDLWGWDYVLVTAKRKGGV